jgi:hypothetical protein
MGIQHVGAESALTLSFRPPQSGEVRVFVSAEEPVQTYVVNHANLRRFRRGEPFYTVAGYARRQREHRFNAQIAQPRRWYLIIYNPNDVEVAFYCQVEAA